MNNLKPPFSVYYDGNKYVTPPEWTPREVAELMELYYFQNDLYQNVVTRFRKAGIFHPAIKALSNPVMRFVEFYVDTIAPGSLPQALPIRTENPAVEDAISTLYADSNFSIKKDFLIRQHAITGEGFAYVAANPETGRLWINVAHTKNIPEYVEDEQGNIIFLRYETKVNKDGKDLFHTETWEPGIRRIWEHTRGYDQEIDKLGEPSEVEDHAGLGIGMVPWVRFPFREVGEGRAIPGYWPTLTKIDNLNLIITRLDQMLFRENKATWAILANAMDKHNRPYPAPKIDDRKNEEDRDSDPITRKDSDFIRLPGMSDIKSLVPNLDFDAFINAIEMHAQDIRSDLPELEYYTIQREGLQSGRALALRLGPAINRAKQIRGQFESGLIRLHNIAFSIGEALGIDTYKVGDTEHGFEERGVLSTNPDDIADRVDTYRQAGLPLKTTMREIAGWTEEQIDQLVNDMEEGENALDQAVQSEAAIAKAVEKIAPALEGMIEDISGQVAAGFTQSDIFARFLKQAQKQQNQGQN